MNALKLTVILSASLFLQGCVGVGIWSKEKTAIDNPSISDAVRLDGVMRGREGSAYTAAWLQSHWGPPKGVRPGSATGEELWTYEFGQCWCGVIPMLVIPIPLVLPAGHEHVVFVIRDGRVIGAQRVESRRSGAGFGLIGPDGPWAGGSFK
jgi:hypothetical protein